MTSIYFLIGFLAVCIIILTAINYYNLANYRNILRRLHHDLKMVDYALNNTQDPAEKRDLWRSKSDIMKRINAVNREFIQS